MLKLQNMLTATLYQVISMTQLLSILQNVEITKVYSKYEKYATANWNKF